MNKKKIGEKIKVSEICFGTALGNNFTVHMVMKLVPQ